MGVVVVWCASGVCVCVCVCYGGGGGGGERKRERETCYNPYFVS